MGHLRYNFKMALKPTVKNIISVLSLALGLSLALLLFGKVMYEKSYDNFHENSDRLYLVKSHSYSEGDKRDGGMVTVPSALMPALEAEMPEMEQGTHFRIANLTYEVDNNKFVMSGLIIDTSFFDVLSFGLITGNPREDFQELKTIYLSESKAADLFGGSDPIGKTLVKDSDLIYTVKGIFKDFPKNSIITFRAQGKVDFLEPMIQYRKRDTWGWHNGNNISVILLNNGVSKQQADEKIKQIVDTKYDPVEAAAKNQSIWYLLTPMSDVNSGNRGMIIILSLISFMALLVIAVSALNYSLISVASLGSRLKEFAIHKYSGASRLAIIGMVFVQTAFQTLFATGLAILLISALRDQIEQFLMPVEAIFSVSNMLNIIYIVLIVVIVSAIIPSRIFANISVMSLFRDSRNSHKLWKKIMLFLQFLTAIIFLALALVGNNQYYHMFNKDIGYKYDNLVYTKIKINDRDDFSKYRDGLMELDFVEDVSFSDNIILHDFGGFHIMKDGASSFSAKHLRTSGNFFDVLEMDIIDGKPYVDGGNYYDVVVNEIFVRRMNWDRSKSAVGNLFYNADGRAFHVIGVVKNFEYAFTYLNNVDFHPTVMSPTIANGWNDSYTNITIKLNDFSTQNFEAITATLEKLNPSASISIDTYENKRTFNYSFMKKAMDGISLAGIIIFLITIIGLYGYISNELQYKHREIALRKVYGASFFLIIKMIYLPIFKILCVATPLGIVIIYGITLLLKSQMPSMIPMSWWIFVAIPLFVILLTYGIVAARAFKIASENPIKAIYE